MRKQVVLLLTISILFISFAAIFVKLSESPATIISMYRMGLSALFLLPIAFLKRNELNRLSKKEWLLLTSAGVFLALHFAFWFESLKLTTVASSTIILSLQPLVSLAFGYLFFRERVSLVEFMTIAIAIVGVSMIGWSDVSDSNPAMILGDVLSFLSVVAIVVYLFVGRNIVKKISHWLYSFSVFFIAACTLALYNAFKQIPMSGYGIREWGIFLLLAILPTMAHVIFNYLLNVVPPTTISLSILGEPVGATLLAFLLLEEAVTAMQLVGGAFVLFGVFLYIKHRS